MSLKRVLAFGALGLAMVACDRDTEGTLLPQERIGGVRYVHASPDTRALDFRVVDIPSNAGMFGAPFRMTLPFHTALRAGNRSFRAFVSSSHVDTAQIRMMDIQHNIVEGTRYTIHLAGLSASDVFVTEDNAPDPGAGNYTIRLTHMGVNMPNVDVYVNDASEENPQPRLQIASNLAYGEAGSWTAAVVGPNRILEVTEAGTEDVILLANIPAGSDPTATGQTAVPGTTQAGSGITAILFPPSVPETLAQQFANPGVVFVYDRRP